MKRKTFSSNNTLVVLAVLITGTILLTFFFKDKEVSQEKVENSVADSPALDFTLKQGLVNKIEEALAVYPVQGWSETRKLLKEVKAECKTGNCDREVFFNEMLDPMAKTFTELKEFIYAASTLGLFYPSNGTLADLDGDARNEVVLLQRDALNVDRIILKVIDFQEKTKVTDYPIERSYFSSQNSSLTPPNPLKVLDLTGDTLPEIILFLSPGREGADLYIFRYRPGHLTLVLQKDELTYPEFTFTDTDNNGRLEIIIEGHSPETGKNIRKAIDLIEG